jgi:chaperone required for assembly of F1-ATPase
MTDFPSEEKLQELARDRFNRPLPKKFYKQATIGPDNAVLLDGRAVKTPMKASLQLPTQALAEAVVEEWNAQVTFINPATMPLTTIANTAIDRAVSERVNILAEIKQYAGSDLICYRAASPQNLVELQNAAWNPIIADAEAALGNRFLMAEGIVHVAQHEATLQAVYTAAEHYGPFHLTILFNLTTLTGSSLIALGLVAGRISVEQGWTAAHVDEDYQIAQWGLDYEAQTRREGRRSDYDGLLRFLNLLQQR